MRVLVCGSRHFKDEDLMEKVLDEFRISTIIEGEARGADVMARQYGERRNIPVEPFPADWNKYGKAAGPIRNSQMLKEGRPDLVIAFKYEGSRGTQNMIDQAKRKGIEVHEVNPQ